MSLCQPHTLGSLNYCLIVSKREKIWLDNLPIQIPAYRGYLLIHEGIELGLDPLPDLQWHFRPEQQHDLKAVVDGDARLMILVLVLHIKTPSVHHAN